MKRKDLLEIIARVDVYIAIVTTLTLAAVVVMLVWSGVV